MIQNRVRLLTAASAVFAAVSGCLFGPSEAQDISTTIEVSSTRAFVPLQSYVAAETPESLLFFGGLVDMGMHVFASNAFPLKNFNTDIVLVEKPSGTVHLGSISHLSPQLREALIMTAPTSVQFGGTFYIFGGYGPAIIEPDYTTRDTVTAVDLPAVEAAILGGQPVPASAFTVSQSAAAQVAGAGIVKFSDGNRFALICGANAIGDYAQMGDPIYTAEVHIFDRTVSMTVPIQTFNDGKGFDSPMRRRDVNTLPVTMPATRGAGTRDGFVVVAGAFNFGFFMFENPLIWADGDPMPYEDTLFIQHIGAYEGPVASLYSERHDTNHILIYSGISFYEPDGQGGFIQNWNSPWTDVATNMKMVGGEFVSDQIIGDMPWPLTNAKLIINDQLQRNALGQVLVDELPCGEPVLLGRIFGGIAAEFPADAPPTYASDSVLDIYITIEPEPGVRATLEEPVVEFGVHQQGGVAELLESDDTYFVVRSQFGFSAVEPNILRVRYRFSSPVPAPDRLHVLEEARLNNSGGFGAMSLRNFASGVYEEILAYPMYQTDTVQRRCDLDAMNYVDSKGTILLRIKHVVVATFSATGFDAFIDQVEIRVVE